MRDSDATVIISDKNEVEHGIKLTLPNAKKLNKPWLHLCRCNPHDKLHNQNCEELAAFLQKHDVAVLNIPGSRESEAPGIGDYVKMLLNHVYDQLG